MELKTYQKQVMDDLSAYLVHMNREDDIFAAWKGYWNDCVIIGQSQQTLVAQGVSLI